ncbi:MAG: tyrosine-type recombinase/integrase [Methylovirgula sp.]
MGRTNRLAGNYKNLGLPKGRRTHFYCDGGGLYLQVTKGTAGLCRSWVFRYAVKDRFVERDGKRWQATRYMGLGPIADISLNEARELARDQRKLLREGRDPIAERDRRVADNVRAQASIVTFAECAALFIRQKEPDWKNEKHAKQWRATLARYASPVIGKMSVADIQFEHVTKVLGAVWKDKPETANRVRGRIENILEFATVNKWRTGDNPARWKGNLSVTLPKPTKVRPIEHRPALPYSDVPAFLAQLRLREGAAARALEFAILTGARSGEVRGMTWSEISLREKLWTVPAERMKGSREHRVPLSERAREILEQVGDASGRSAGAIVFAGSAGRPMSDMSLTAVLRRMERREITVHGFRSSFRDWTKEETQFSREVAEAALAHRLGDAAEQAYSRSDVLKKRGPLMDAWADYCEGKPAEKVVKLRR